MYKVTFVEENDSVYQKVVMAIGGELSLKSPSSRTSDALEILASKIDEFEKRLDKLDK